ncbi:Hpt domain-containing protein [Anaerosporobacter sp.]|uniref:Hpt domain-containing protein n=1 Tax=Anaerosporobacter sp. TaxID=1872529 RepID=UPI00286F67F4|nr:Hpt domain-containing protein [Anaerosporobacter sp.]
MNENTLQELEAAGIDVTAGINRFLGDDSIYLSFLLRFPQEESFGQLESAIQQSKWQEATEYAHALKGLCGNLGLNKLFQICSDMVTAGRNGEEMQIAALYQDVRAEYETICSVLNGKGNS